MYNNELMKQLKRLVCTQTLLHFSFEFFVSKFLQNCESYVIFIILLNLNDHMKGYRVLCPRVFIKFSSVLECEEKHTCRILRRRKNVRHQLKAPNRSYLYGL